MTELGYWIYRIIIWKRFALDFLASPCYACYIFMVRIYVIYVIYADTESLDA